MKLPAIVFLDANVRKRAIQARVRTIVTPTKLQWGPIEVEVPAARYEHYDPTDEIINLNMRGEAKLLGQVAELAHAGRIRFQTGIETNMEFWGLRDTRGASVFDGVPIETIESPLKHGRVMFAAGHDSDRLQRDFLARIKTPRFLEMKRALGAHDPNSKRYRNLLADIFHVWTADEYGADYLLTLDARLCRAVRGQPQLKIRTKVVQPSELLAAVPPPPLRWLLQRKLNDALSRFRRKERPDLFPH